MFDRGTSKGSVARQIPNILILLSEVTVMKLLDTKQLKHEEY